MATLRDLNLAVETLSRGKVTVWVGIRLHDTFFERSSLTAEIHSLPRTGH